jgi:nucleotide-binding universal stress UspA family protein
MIARDVAADAIVVGKVPHGAIGDALLGGVAAHLVHHPPCPVVIVPSRSAHPAKMGT